MRRLALIAIPAAAALLFAPILVSLAEEQAPTRGKTAAISKAVTSKPNTSKARVDKSNKTGPSKASQIRSAGKSGPAGLRPARPLTPPRINADILDPTLNTAVNSPANGTDQGLSILHIGDSHTSADFFTGEIRRRLQARYGIGAPGYITAGRPHSGVRSSTIKITASPGWTYKSLQRPDAQTDSFWLSGYNSVADLPGEVMSFSSVPPVAFDLIEIETIRQPGGGSIDISLNGVVARHESLASDVIEPRVIRLTASPPGSQFNDISITTTAHGKSQVSSVSIFNRGDGLTYNSVGYVGATVGVLNKMNELLLQSDLTRINPQIVVLSFGTNEAANEHLDVAQYASSYERVVKKIQRALPTAPIIVISPPDFNAAAPTCRKDNIATATCRPAAADVSEPQEMSESWQVAAKGLSPAPSAKSACTWHTPSKLAEVRDAQREIAKQNGLIFWDWGDLMPRECGAHQWYGMSPPLMSSDHVHLTGEGYRKSAEQFLKVLIPVVERLKGNSGTALAR